MKCPGTSFKRPQAGIRFPSKACKPKQATKGERAEAFQLPCIEAHGTSACKTCQPRERVLLCKIKRCSADLQRLLNESFDRFWFLATVSTAACEQTSQRVQRRNLNRQPEWHLERDSCCNTCSTTLVEVEEQLACTSRPPVGSKVRLGRRPKESNSPTGATKNLREDPPDQHWRSQAQALTSTHLRHQQSGMTRVLLEALFQVDPFCQNAGAVKMPSFTAYSRVLVSDASAFESLACPFASCTVGPGLSFDLAVLVGRPEKRMQLER